jgi:hypoxanthine phosphoribosyltransferase
MVDDLCDSGKTMMWYSTAADWTCTTAVIYVKKHSEFRPDYFVEEIPSEYWVRWPWEDPKEIPNRPGYEGD